MALILYHFSVIQLEPSPNKDAANDPPLLYTVELENMNSIDGINGYWSEGKSKRFNRSHPC